MPRGKPPCANSFSKRSETLLFEVQLQMSSFVVTTRFNNPAVVGLFQVYNEKSSRNRSA
jgi:hypothetical protein